MKVVQNPLNQLWYIQQEKETNTGFANGAVFESAGYKTEADAKYALANGNWATEDVAETTAVVNNATKSTTIEGQNDPNNATH